MTVPPTPGSTASFTCFDHPPLPDPLSILLIGEGNLSFAYALVRRLSRSVAFRRATHGPTSPRAASTSSSVVSLTATTFDSENELAAKYPESMTFRAYFTAKQRVPTRYVGCVNATALSSSLSAAHVNVDTQPFHLLVFNNPHIGFEDLYRQRSLLSHFFASAAELLQLGVPLSHPQEVVVALCDDQAQRWDLLGCAARSGYLCVAAQPLLLADYPEYTNRRHQSDAAFPFRSMVQFWFVQPTPGLAAILLELRDEMMLWEGTRHERMERKEPCGFSCASWLQFADTLLASTPLKTPGAEVEAATTTTASAASLAERCRDAGSTLNYTVSDSTMPMPLLHPKLVSHVLSLLLPSSNAAAAQSGSAYFTPYLPCTAWASLYRAQRWLEERQPVGSAGSNRENIAGDAAFSAVPPHLDAAKLGRPLTAKEAKKLERYLTGYGAAMQTKVRERREREALRAVSAGKVGGVQCSVCTPPRVFDTELDLEQHQQSKHSGAVQLAPTLYARVHTQIVKPLATVSDDALSAALERMTLVDRTDYFNCAVCGLQYKTRDAYEEHLRYLAPLPGDIETSLTCDLCRPSKRFTDRRGLEQHRSSKHPSA